ncbi:GNAT family N-acetyltransferase [Streptomyces chumphonensis]|uniref:GNAT family N-acetyltransferase n=1 Tax=Streptomyces chumphonensis TaxID=1214925 RepID=A0A927F3L4_9ACTN|nr:GNAT family N-acetyltransferase [Streptomyces chumphonensis]MBD3933559.1 GNAT family N-acetyltransferase [Streptomyces chumphonensis]
MIDTERLHLRPLTADDTDRIVELTSEPEVGRYLPALDPEQLRARVGHLAAQWGERGYGVFAVELRHSGELVGRVGLIDWPQFDEVEVGWTLRRDAWGHGYATEAARACVDFGFATCGKPYLTCNIHPDNAPSFRVAERLGFRRFREDTLLGMPVVVNRLDRPTAA